MFSLHNRLRRLLVLDNAYAYLYEKGRGLVSKIAISQFFRYGNIQNASDFSTALQTLTSNSKDYLVTCLSTELLYDKVIVAQNQCYDSDAITKFLEAIPLEKSQITHKEVNLNDGCYVFAIDNKLIEILIKSKARLSAVVPLSLFLTEYKDVELTTVQIEKILDNVNLINIANIYKPKSTSHTKFIYLLFLALFLTTIALAQLFAMYKPVPNAKTPPTHENAVELDNITKETTQTTQTTQSYKNKNELKIKLLNVSGTPGIASKSKTKLLLNSYNNIDTGNSDENKQLTIEYTDLVNVADIDTIINTLDLDKGKVNLVKTGQFPSGNFDGYDIVIYL